MSQELADKTWSEVAVMLGREKYKVRPLRDVVFVRTDPMPEKFENSVLFVPHKYTDFFGELPAKVTIHGTVVSAGPKATVKEGERVAFCRINYARWLDMDDRTKLGWISEADLFGMSES